MKKPVRHLGSLRNKTREIKRETNGTSLIMIIDLIVVYLIKTLKGKREIREIAFGQFW